MSGSEAMRLVKNDEPDGQVSGTMPSQTQQEMAQPDRHQLETTTQYLDEAQTVALYSTRLRSNQSVRLNLRTMEDVVLPVRAADESVTFYTEPGVIAIANFTTPPIETEDPKNPEQPVLKSYRLQPTAIAAARRTHDTAVIAGLLQNDEYNQRRLRTTPKTDGDALRAAVEVLTNSKQRDSVVVGHPSLFDKSALTRSDDMRYGYTVFGPDAEAPRSICGVGFDLETQEAGIVPFASQDLRRSIGEGAVRMSAVLVLEADGQVVVSGPDVWFKNEDQEPYVCCIINTRSPQETTVMPAKLVESFQAGFYSSEDLSAAPAANSQRPTRSLGDIVDSFGGLDDEQSPYNRVDNLDTLNALALPRRRGLQQ